ncbi:MAG TPA: hypothetical protein VF941_05890 [Clostridia bacterium]
MRKLKLGTEVSFVFCLVDAFTGEAAKNGSYKIILPPCSKAPLYKDDGFVVFCGIPSGNYIIDIFSDKYHNESVAVSVPEDFAEPPVSYISLKPRPSYIFAPDATLIRLSVVDENNLPVKDAKIVAEIISSECMRGKIAKVPVKKGDNEFYISSITGKVSVRDEYQIGNEDDKKEFIVIDRQLDKLRHYSIRNAFQHDHDRGSSLMPVVKAITDDRGEAVVYFRSMPVKYFNVNITINYKDIRIERKVTMEEGKTTYIGRINL